MAPKPLSDFPRPPDDNGRGVHWSASVYHPAGTELQHWIEELQATQIKWVKLLDDGGGSSIDICRLFIANGIMPIVRMYRERPNPGSIGGREKDAIRGLVDVGVAYFETNNEPNLRGEWQDGVRPANWLEIVVDNFIRDADFILNTGGYPALPSMGPSSQADAVSMVVQKGRADIFERGGWMAIHNYTLNHPLDYPDDEVNQSGKPLTAEEFAYYKHWQFSHLSQEEAALEGISAADYIKYENWGWDGRSLEMVNELRATNKNPGKTVFDDSNCFRGYEVWGQRIHDVLGYHVPIISTEGGPVAGWGDDKRYAKVNPDMQAAWQMEINRFMQDEAPEWYFTCCTWLLASRPLGDWNPTWDQMSWYTDVWNEQFGLAGELPIVQMMKDMPALIRHELRPTGAPSAVIGTVSGRDGQPLAGVALSLRDQAGVWASTQSGTDGRYRLQAAPGQYDLWVAWFGPVAHDIMLSEEDTDTLDLSDFNPPGQFAISGLVRDENDVPQAGVTVELRRNGLAHGQATTDAAGAFTFTPGLAGNYALDTTGGSAEASVDPAQPTATIEIRVPAPPDPHYALTEKRLLSAAETGNRRLFYGRVKDAAGRGIKGIEMEMRWTKASPGTRFPRTRTGQNPFIPDADGYFEFLHSPGEFLIEVVQGDHASDIADGLLTTGVPGREGEPITYEVDFQLQGVIGAKPGESRVWGRVPGGRAGQVLQLWGGGKTVSFVLDAARQFHFNDLPAGVYDLFLAGVGIVVSEIVLDGGNERELEIPLLGAIIGRMVNASPGRRGITLISESHGFSRRAELSAGENYRFTNLPAGRYRIQMGDAMLSGLRSNGQSVVQAPPFDVLADPIALSAIFGVITAAETGRSLPGLTVTLLNANLVVASAISDAQGRYEIANVTADVYALAVEGRIVATDIVIDGEQDRVIDLVYPQSDPDHPFSRYYLVGMSDSALNAAALRVLSPWLATQPSGVIGFSPSEAGKATVVVAFGDGISDGVLAGIESAGARVIDRRLNLLALAAMVDTDLQGDNGDA